MKEKEKKKQKKITITGVKTELELKQSNKTIALVFVFILRILIALLVRILVLLFLMGIIYICLNVGKYIFYSNSNTRVFYEISRCITRPYNEETMENDTVIDFGKLKEINTETVGWLKVQNAGVNIPIVKTKDNDFYLGHNYFKGSNPSGWIFVDYTNKLDGTDKNIVLYGKDFIDGTMFGGLDVVLTQGWLNNTTNKIISYITPTEKLEYEVFSVYKTKDKNLYAKTDFAEGEFDVFLDTVKSRSVKDFGTAITGADSILTLSTWGKDNENKIVLHAKRVVPGEQVPENPVPESPIPENSSTEIVNSEIT